MVVFLLNVRLSLIIFLAIPLSILAAIIGLFYTDDTINAMTLGGLALAIGILVDQSIVVLENVVRHVNMGKLPAEAAYDGTREVAVPILVATITFCVVFYPVVFLSGMAKFLFTPLAISASIAILASYLIAVTLVPAYCARFLVPSTVSATVTKPCRFVDLSVRLVRNAIRWRWAVLLGTAMLFVGSLATVASMGTELFPPVDSGQFTIYVRLPSGTRIEKTEQTIHRIEKSIIGILGEPDPAFGLGNEKHPESALQILISNIGVLMDWPAAYTPNTGPMDAFILVQLKERPGRPEVFGLVTELQDALRDQFPSVEFAFDTGGMMTAALNMGEPSPIHFQITGSNVETAQAIARSISEEAKQVPGTADVRIAQRMDYPVLKVEMDRVLAAYQGVTIDDAMKNFVSATNSSINCEPAFWIDPRNGNHYFLGIQYREQDINWLNTLQNIPITGEGSVRPALLRNIATIEQSTGPAEINHRNITRATDIYANILPGYDVGTIVAAIEERLQNSETLKLVPRDTERGQVFSLDGPDFSGRGYTVEMQGEVRSMRDSFVQFSQGLLIAVVLGYLVMVAQFGSFRDPLIILLTVPLGFIGVVALLYLTGTSISIMAFKGIIMMVGIVVEYPSCWWTLRTRDCVKTYR